MTSAAEDRYLQARIRGLERELAETRAESEALAEQFNRRGETIAELRKTVLDERKAAEARVEKLRAALVACLGVLSGSEMTKSGLIDALGRGRDALESPATGQQPEPAVKHKPTCSTWYQSSKNFGEPNPCDCGAPATGQKE